jgi:hypothetical protein
VNFIESFARKESTIHAVHVAKFFSLRIEEILTMPLAKRLFYSELRSTMLNNKPKIIEPTSFEKETLSFIEAHSDEILELEKLSEQLYIDTEGLKSGDDDIDDFLSL